MVLDTGKEWDPEDWQAVITEDLFAGFRENWVIIPEGNGKTTWLGALALYCADYALSPWIPIGAASRKQASILFTQAAGFVQRTPGLEKRFRVYGGYLKIDSLRQGGRGIEVYAADDNTGDGVIPYPLALVDEPHRMKDMRLYRLWAGKLRKRDAQIATISTAGEPGTEFEEARDAIRNKATERERNGAHLRAVWSNGVMHEWMVRDPADVSNMDKVAEANPLSLITAKVLKEQFDSATVDLGDWQRLKCNRPTKSAETAIVDAVWDGRVSDLEDIPEGEPIDVGADFAWKWDTTALVPFWMPERNERLLGQARILEPPRDGSLLDPQLVKDALGEITERNPIQAVVMDMSRAEDIAAWLEGELGIAVIDRGQSNQFAVPDFESFMDGLRNGTLKHTGDHGLKSQVLNAIARRLPGGDYRFDRPSTVRQNARAQDRRVIDALTAAAMVVQHSTRAVKKISVYEERIALFEGRT